MLGAADTIAGIDADVVNTTAGVGVDSAEADTVPMSGMTLVEKAG